MDLNAAEQLAQTLIEQHLPGKSWLFQWNSARRSFGRCNYSTKTISLSKPLNALRDESNVRNTILHEIAHALAPNHGHGQQWKLTARSIGAKPERCGNIQAEGIEPPRGKWTGTCPQGHITTRFRRPKRQHSCAVCRPHFDPAYLFVWTHASGAVLQLI